MPIVERKDVGVSRHLPALGVLQLLSYRKAASTPIPHEDIITKTKTTYRLPSLDRMLTPFHCQRDETRTP